MNRGIPLVDVKHYLNTNLDDKVNKASITTTIDSSSTDSEIATAKSVYDNIQNIKLPMIKYDTTKDLLEQIKTTFDGKDRSFSFKILNATIGTNSVPENGNFQGIVYGEYGKYFTIMMTCVGSSVTYTGIVFGGNFLGWRRICTTSVADVDVKNIAPSDTTTFINFKGNSSCNYYVKNGVCYVSLWGVKIASTGSVGTDLLLPRCENGYAGGMMTGDGDGTCHAFAYVSSSGELIFNVKDANVYSFCTFSYPVA